MLSLIPTNAADLKDVIRMEHHPDNKEFIIPYSLSQHQQALESEDEAHLKLTTEEGSTIGFVLLAGLNNPNQSVEFRRIVVALKGMGYGRQAVALVKEHCFEHLLCHRLWLDVFEDNGRARQLYKSEGFIEEGTMRECIKQDGIYRNLVFMSMLQREYLRPARH
ncbi:GNAT family N-acetyltransferase [Cesiribacter sp. SM1]|uniref:GNAT family N-acetyltransferase n=1 Tax=Cesiribacter sp. SM1 TaxID=2861196 RepID=UPI001CD75F69|nr:GNAT family protein [Cesiribacter sp. SM1]